MAQSEERGGHDPSPAQRSPKDGPFGGKYALEALLEIATKKPFFRDGDGDELNEKQQGQPPETSFEGNGFLGGFPPTSLFDNC